MARCNTIRSAAAVAADCATWPEDCRRRWTQAFDPDFGTHDWSRASQYTYARVFTRYLTLVKADGVPQGGCAITAKGVRRFIKEAESKARPRTVAGYVHQLLEAASIVYPDAVSSGALDWLWRTRDRLNAVAGKTQKIRRRQVVGAEVLLRLARKALLDGKERDDFIAVRTGVFIMLGIHMPERRRALAGLNIDMIDLGTGIVRLPAHLQKTREEVVRVLPRRIVLELCDYIDHWRRRYTDERGGALFITTKGRRVGGEALRAAMVTLTARELGVRVPPHLMRNAVATTVVEADPANAPLATAALLHRNVETTKEYTEMAHGLTVGRSAVRLLSDAYRTTERAVRATTGSRIAELRSVTPERKGATITRPA